MKMRIIRNYNMHSKYHFTQQLGKKIVNSRYHHNQHRSYTNIYFIALRNFLNINQHKYSLVFQMLSTYGIILSLYSCACTQIPHSYKMKALELRPPQIFCVYLPDSHGLQEGTHGWVFVCVHFCLTRMTLKNTVSRLSLPCLECLRFCGIEIPTLTAFVLK